eukprot:403364608
MTDPLFSASNNKPKGFGSLGKLGSEAYPKNTGVLKDEEEDKIQDYSDEEWDLDDDKEEARKKQEILKTLEEKKVVRKYEEQKAKGLIKASDDADRGADGSLLATNQFLDDLWDRVRNFLNDLNEKGDRREFGRNDKANKLKFLDYCQEQESRMKKGVLTESQLEAVFAKCKFFPMPSKAEFKLLYKALEAFVSNESNEVNYNKILEAPVKREHTSINGIFPKIKAKGPSAKQIEEQKRKEEEEKKKQLALELEEKKRKEIADKRIEQAKKKDLGYKKVTKEEQKMKEREEQLKLEGERKEIERKQKEETDAVRNEVNEYRKSIAQIQKAILDSRENLRNWFKLFDENNDNFMEFEEFKKLLQQVKVVVKDKDLKNLFELMDISQTGRISYNDFCDVIEKNQLLPIDKIVRKRREERGEKFIDEFSKGEKDFEFEGSQPFKSAFGELGGSQRKDLGTVDGMSDIMRRSDADFDGRQLIQEDDTILIFNDIKEQLRLNFHTFDDILQKMGRPDALVPQSSTQVTSKDFETLIKGMPTGYKYSTQQLKNVFKLYSQQSAPSFGGISGDAFIPTIDFKDRFFPGIFWQRNTQPQIGQSSAPSNSSFGLGDSLRSSNLES